MDFRVITESETATIPLETLVRNQLNDWAAENERCIDARFSDLSFDHEAGRKVRCFVMVSMTIEGETPLPYQCDVIPVIGEGYSLQHILDTQTRADFIVAGVEPTIVAFSEMAFDNGGQDRVVVLIGYPSTIGPPSLTGLYPQILKFLEFYYDGVWLVITIGPDDNDPRVPYTADPEIAILQKWSWGTWLSFSSPYETAWPFRNMECGCPGSDVEPIYVILPVGTFTITLYEIICGGTAFVGQVTAGLGNINQPIGPFSPSSLSKLVASFIDD